MEEYSVLFGLLAVHKINRPRVVQLILPVINTELKKMNCSVFSASVCDRRKNDRIYPACRIVPKQVPGPSGFEENSLSIPASVSSESGD